MNTDNWQPFYKLTSKDQRGMAQQTYEPLINPEKNIFCANYNWPTVYQCKENRPYYTKEVVDYFFLKEVEYINRFAKKTYMPKVIDIDEKSKKIYFDWYGITCNEMIFSAVSMPVNWKKQIQFIMLDLYQSGVYKLTMYPHCHFFDKDGQMKAIDWYGCVEKKFPFIQTKYMDGIIHESAIFRLKETGKPLNDLYNLEIMFKRSLQEHVLWGDNTMNFIYCKIFKNV